MFININTVGEGLFIILITSYEGVLNSFWFNNEEKLIIVRSPLRFNTLILVVVSVPCISSLWSAK